MPADLQQGGALLLAGTDVDDTFPFLFFGFSLHDELSLAVKGGLTPLAALQCATINPARFLGREAELGTVTAGTLADLVLLDANPMRISSARNASRPSWRTAATCRGWIWTRCWTARRRW